LAVSMATMAFADRPVGGGTCTGSNGGTYAGGDPNCVYGACTQWACGFLWLSTCYAPGTPLYCVGE
jgi:hypothetical protein